jgi:hypothetical protein
MDLSATFRRRLAYPSTLLLLGANLLPLAGVLFWGWDAFVLLALYWLETAIIGFWMLVRLATAPEGSQDIKFGDEQTAMSRRGAVLFFMVHAGMFMGVHFVFLWVLFSGDWSRRIHGPIEFVAKLVIATGLWLPLLVLFLARGAMEFYAMYGARVLAWLGRRAVKPAAPAEDGGSIIGAFYTRVIVMHVAIIFGAFLSVLGSIGPLIVMIVVKTAIDVALHVALDFGGAGKAFTALLRAREEKLHQRAES